MQKNYLKPMIVSTICATASIQFDLTKGSGMDDGDRPSNGAFRADE